MFVTVARNIKGRVRRPADSSVLSIATAKFRSNSSQRERVSTDSLPHQLRNTLWRLARSEQR
ncbi:hypothetical protein [Rothia dentocariosa]|uniref:hypothetical protein n=1 Tax=Rothia dentocariosa TaxID=2047 RepID=UPI0028E6C208|nr:hypothetical protein [Rothia dentocariosa]